MMQRLQLFILKAQLMQSKKEIKSHLEPNIFCQIKK